MGRGLSIVEKDPVSTKQLVLASPPPAASRRRTDWDLTVPLLSPRLFIRISQRKGGAGACPLSRWTKHPPYILFWPPPPPAASWRLTEWGLTMPFLSPKLFV